MASNFSVALLDKRRKYDEAFKIKVLRLDSTSCSTVPLMSRVLNTDVIAVTHKSAFKNRNVIDLVSLE